MTLLSSDLSKEAVAMILMPVCMFLAVVLSTALTGIGYLLSLFTGPIPGGGLFGYFLQGAIVVIYTIFILSMVGGGLCILHWLTGWGESTRRRLELMVYQPTSNRNSEIARITNRYVRGDISESELESEIDAALGSELRANQEGQT